MMPHRVASDWETMKSSSSRVRLAARASDRRWRAAMSDEYGAAEQPPLDRHVGLPRMNNENDDDDAEFFRMQTKISDARHRHYQRLRGAEKNSSSSSSHRREGAWADVDRMLSALKKASRRVEADARDTAAATHLCNLAADCAGQVAQEGNRNPLIGEIQHALIMLSRGFQAMGHPETTTSSRAMSVGNTVQSEHDLRLTLGSGKIDDRQQRKKRRSQRRRRSDSRLSTDSEAGESFIEQYHARWAKSEQRRAAKPKGDKLLATVLKSMNDSIRDDESGSNSLGYDWASELMSEELMRTGAGDEMDAAS
jgi:hypothetical protein